MIDNLFIEFLDLDIILNITINIKSIKMRHIC